MKIISLFSGCGGFDLGFIQRGFEVVKAYDFDKYAVETYRENIGDHIELADLTLIDPASAPDCDVIIGGFPCQDFSMMGARQGIGAGDGRGALYKVFINFLKIKKPKYFVAENVPGLLSSNKGSDWVVIREDLESVGYMVDVKVIDFSDLGVSQKRKRLIVLGSRLDCEIVKIPEVKKECVTAGEALANIPDWATDNEPLPTSDEVAARLALIPPGGNLESIPDGHPLKCRGGKSIYYRRLHSERPSTTLIATGGGGTWGYHWSENRRLTIRELARLHSYPDDFKFPVPKTQARKQIGNSVPPKGVWAVADAIGAGFALDKEKLNRSI